MLFLLSKTQLGLIIGAIAAFLVLVVVVTILIVKGRSKTKYLSKVDYLLSQVDIDNKSQIDAYLIRLKNISNNNDSYIEIYNQMNSQFDLLISVERDKLVARHRGLKERIGTEAKIKKGLIEQIRSYENAINNYKKEIKRIQTDLESYFKQGDELRIKLTSLQEKYQEIVSETNKFSSSLSICKYELNEYLSEIELYFDVFDGNLSGARYNEAEKNLLNIEKLILNVYGHIETIAQYCKMVEVIIPNQLEDLIKKNNDLKEQGYVVAHCKVFEFVENTKNILEGCKKDFKHLCFSNFEEISYEIQAKFSEIHAHLDQEVLSKNELEIKYVNVNEKVNRALAEFIKTKRQFATMIEYYQIPNEYSIKFKEFENNATTLTSLRIEYEGLLLLQNRHPASYMLGKLESIDESVNLLLDDISFFTTYFKNIRDFVESSYRKTNELLVMLSLIIGKVRYQKCKPIYNKYIDKVNNSIYKLKNVNSLLMKKPIDITTLNNNFSSIVIEAEELEVSINNELDNYNTVSKCIVFANPLRAQFSEVNKVLDEIDELFIAGDYITAQEKLNKVLNSYHPAAFSSFKGK